MPKIEVDENLCKGCYLCIKACPKKCLGKSKNFSKTGYFPAEMTDQPACIGCSMCYMVCPDLAITVFK
ncbi:2-oxoglutarate ferredoxin oxidoreductase subunit delta [Elusimicrobium posterum]|uniref:4Fe-4S dicluster domain-containing protein n=1 Tax=Elusimicrobium posterum TaxID=3116653 RepID=UPI003C749E2E